MICEALVIMILWDVLHALNILLVLLFLSHLNVKKTLFFAVITILTLFPTSLISLIVNRYAYFFLFIARDIVWDHAEIKGRNYSLDKLFSRLVVSNQKLWLNKLVTVFGVKTKLIFTIRIAWFETCAKSTNQLMEASSRNRFKAVIIVNLVNWYTSVLL